jgi:hypothetical protein
MCAPRRREKQLARAVSWRGVRLARRNEGACRRHVTEEATPPDGRLAGKPGVGFGAKLRLNGKPL